MSFANRLRALIGEGSANAFARECSIGESSVRQYLAGGIPGLDKVIQIARAKNVHIEWLATGEGPRDIQPEAALPDAGTYQEHKGGSGMQVVDPTKLDAGMVLLPRLNVEASAGQGVALSEEEVEGFMAFKIELLKEMGINPRNAHVLKIKGDSMFPTLKDRDIIIIDASVIEVIDEGLYTLVLGDVVRAKRLQPHANGSVRIISDNKAEGYADEIVSRPERDTLRIVGRIRGVLRYFED